MKKLSVVGDVVLFALVCFHLAGCATPGQARRYFHDQNSASLVLQFSSWDYIFVRHPAYEEDGGFLCPVKRDQISDVVQKLNVPRNMAVVTVGWQYDPETLAGLVSSWKSVLRKCGFRRIVIVHATFSGKLNGSVIIDDSIANTPAQTARL